MQQVKPTKERRYDLEDVHMETNSRRLPTVTKDTDNPSASPASSRRFKRQDSTTLTTLSRLFAVQASTSPDVSCHPSYVHQQTQLPSTSPLDPRNAEIAALPNHLYHRGLLEGTHSDIVVNAFGQQYQLHRLILDRAPFFKSALSEPWLETNTKGLTVHPEEVDCSITQRSFELALKRLYGCHNPTEEDQEPFGLFATGCWLEMPDVIDSSVESVLRQMTNDRLGPLVRLVTSNYYGRPGDRILTSAKSMLCRDGWKMPLKYWDDIPGDVVREVVGGDGIFVDSEWDRWILAKCILDRRLKHQARAAGLLEAGHRRKIRQAPHTAMLAAVRSDAMYRKNCAKAGSGASDAMLTWITLYTHPDIEPLLILLDEDVHYMHLNFELLQLIRKAKDCIGLPLMPERVLNNALWQQMELRQKIINAHESDAELGMKVQSSENQAPDSMVNLFNSGLFPMVHYDENGKGRSTDYGEEADDFQSGPYDGSKGPRKFWIPSLDRNIVIGGNADPVITFSDDTHLQEYVNQLSPTFHGDSGQRAMEFPTFTYQAQPYNPLSSFPAPETLESSFRSYTHLPPFRFSVEFPSPKLLKENRRVYSRTVFYAGSFWNVYVQKVGTTRSREFGVYLLRARESDGEETIIGMTSFAQGSVDERIGQLERDMILRSEKRGKRQLRRTNTGSDSLEADDAESGGGTKDRNHILSHNVPEQSQSSAARATTMRNLLAQSRRESGRLDDGPVPSTPLSPGYLPDVDEDLYTSGSDSESDDLQAEQLAAALKNVRVSTLPPYMDSRPVIKAYFKIYCPSRGGRMLSVYESPPDVFDFSHAVGWKSSILMLNESLLGEDAEGVSPREDADENANGGRPNSSKSMNGRGDGRCRLMVVLGEI